MLAVHPNSDHTYIAPCGLPGMDEFEMTQDEIAPWCPYGTKYESLLEGTRLQSPMIICKSLQKESCRKRCKEKLSAKHPGPINCQHADKMFMMGDVAYKCSCHMSHTEPILDRDTLWQNNLWAKVKYTMAKPSPGAHTSLSTPAAMSRMLQHYPGDHHATIMLYMPLRLAYKGAPDTRVYTNSTNKCYMLLMKTFLCNLHPRTRNLLEQQEKIGITFGFNVRSACLCYWLKELPQLEGRKWKDFPGASAFPTVVRSQAARTDGTTAMLPIKRSIAL